MERPAAKVTAATTAAMADPIQSERKSKGANTKYRKQPHAK
jgi:hypothetical protein